VFAEVKGDKGSTGRKRECSTVHGGNEMNDLNPEKKPSANDRDHDTRWTETDGIQVNELAEHDVLSITTVNNTYEMVVIHSETAQVMVRGGHYFPSDTLALVSGSSLNSSIKLHGIYVGYAIEFSVAGRRVKTSAVRNIRLLRESELAA
jgi:hypothetical protein